MKTTLLTFALLFALANGAVSQDYLSMSCEDVIAHAEDSQANMMLAASIYTGGKFMGRRCIEPNFERGFELMRMAGFERSIPGVVGALRQRAERGNRTAKKWLPQAEAALEALGL